MGLCAAFTPHNTFIQRADAHWQSNGSSDLHKMFDYVATVPQRVPKRNILIVLRVQTNEDHIWRYVSGAIVRLKIHF